MDPSFRWADGSLRRGSGMLVQGDAGIVVGHRILIFWIGDGRMVRVGRLRHRIIHRWWRWRAVRDERFRREHAFLRIRSSPYHVRATHRRTLSRTMATCFQANITV